MAGWLGVRLHQETQQIQEQNQYWGEFSRPTQSRVHQPEAKQLIHRTADDIRRDFDSFGEEGSDRGDKFGEVLCGNILINIT